MKHTHFSSPRRALLLLTGLLLVVTASMVVPNRAYLMGKLALLRSTTQSSTVNHQAATSQFASNPTPSTSFAVPTLFQGPGIAPTGDPGQGFDIEGNLQANTPNANTTDWVPGVAGTGVGVLTAAGVPVDPTKTFRVVDLYNSQSDDIFTGGSKVNDNPNTDWVWATGKPTAKDDVNNGLLHVSMDANNHLWFVVGGDRLSNNGDSHINFEFLQNTLVKNGDGSFTSAGPNGGRTVGDLLLHIDLQQGGNVPDFMVDRWQAVGAGFDWVTITPAAGTAFVAANVAGTTPVSFGAFGSTTYAMNQFAEGAIDITALIANFDPCIGIKTVFIKTATSQSPTAALKDLIEPIQLNLGNRPVAQAGPDQSACAVTGSPTPTSFTVNGTATNGTPAWTVASTTGTITNADVTIVSPTSASTAVNIAAGKTGTVTLTLTVTSNRVPPCTPAATDQVVLTVTQGAVAIAPTDVTKCQTIGQPTVFSLTGQVTAGSATPLWSYVSSTGTILAGDVTIATPNNPTTSVSIAAGKIGSVTLRLTSATTACGTATDDVVLTVSAAPTADAGPDLATCQAVSGPTTFNLNGTVNNSSGSTWSYVSSTGTILQTDVTIANPFFPSTTVNIANGKTGTVTLALTAVGTKPSCANAVDEVTLTVKALPSCQITGSTSVCAGSINNTYTAPAGANLSYSWSVTGNGMIVGSTTGQSVNITAGVSGSYTVMLTVFDTVTECSSSCSLPVTVNANPACSISGATAVCATSTNNTYTGPAGANLSYSWSVTGNGTIVGSSTGQSINVTAGAAGLYTVNLTVTNTQTGCSSTCVQQVTVNANPACSITGATAVCATSTNNTYTGPAGANLSYSWSVTGNGTIVGSSTGQSVSVTAGAAGSYTVNLTVTNTQTGCSSTCNQQVTVNANPTCSITGATAVCATSTNNTYTGPAGANLSYSWSVTGNGTIVGSSTGQSVNVTAGAAGSYTVNLTVTNTQTNCSSTCSQQVTVNANPACSITGAMAVCASSTNNTYTGPAGANLSYSWSVTGNGTIVGSSTGQSVNVTAGAAGSYTVNLTVTNTQTNCSSTCNQQVTVNALPVCAITGADGVCTTSTNNTYTGPAGANLSYSWSVAGNGTIVGSSTGQSVNVTAGAAGSYTLNLTVTNTQTGCSSTCSKVVTVNGLPACSITGPDTVCPSLTGATYSGPTGANLAYSWAIAGNGTISGSTTGQTVNVNAGASGSFILTLTVTNTQTGCSSTCTKSVPITECDDCGPKGPGQVFPSASQVSDQKAGSVLVYNFYTSIASAPNTQNTRFNITNTSPKSPVAVHLFFIDGTTCSVADSYMCLTANQTASFLASDLDPGTTGYLVAVAVDCQLGCPINFNCLIGDEYIKMASGHVANLGAEAIASLTQNPTNCDSNSVTATINFDGTRYNRIPRVLALGGIGSRADGNDTMLVINRIGGNLGIGAASLGSMFGIFYDDAESALSYTFSGACQFRSSVTNNFPRITPRFETFVPAGRTGWTKFWITGEDGGKGILGASLNFNANTATSANAFSQGHNLHALKLDTTNSYVVPIFPPSCCQ